MQGRISWATLCALFLAAVFVAAIWTTIGFPLGTLGDEWAKIDAVRTGNNRYYHPLLMIEVTQFANLFAGARDLQAIVEVGRTCAALAWRSPRVRHLLAGAAGAARARRPRGNICDGGNADRHRACAHHEGG